jgi:hypothetical protein
LVQALLLLLVLVVQVVLRVLRNPEQMEIILYLLALQRLHLQAVVEGLRILVRGAMQVTAVAEAARLDILAGVQDKRVQVLLVKVMMAAQAPLTQINLLAAVVVQGLSVELAVLAARVEVTAA